MSDSLKICIKTTIVLILIILPTTNNTKNNYSYDRNNNCNYVI